MIRFTRVAFEESRALPRGAIMVVGRSEGCGTKAVPMTGADRDLAAQDDPRVILRSEITVRSGHRNGFRSASFRASDDHDRPPRESPTLLECHTCEANH